jgi:ABC-type glycerol-3-phosphate transport system substrate-binding protein
MKNLIKRLASLFILSLIILSAGCGSQNGNETENTDDTQEQTEETLDFGGYKCNIYQSAGAGGTNIVESPFFYKEDTFFSDQILSRIDTIQNDYNCAISFEYLPGMVNPKVAQEAATGSSGAEILITMAGTDPVTMAYAGLLYPLNEVSSIIDYENSDKFGSAGELECAMYNGIPYSVTAALLPEKQNYGAQPIGVFNGSILKDYALTDPREYIEQKKWTWDTFEKCLQDYYIKDGEKEIKAFAMANFVFTQAAMLNNGVELVVKDGDTLKSGLNSPNAVAAIEWQQKLLRDYKDNIMKVDWCGEAPLLKDGKCVMVLVGAWLLRNPIAYEVENFGLFPFPSGPDGEYGKWVTSLDGIEAISIPAVAEAPEYAAHIINRLCDPFEGYETRDKLLDFYDTLFYDRRDSELFLSFSENARFSYFPTGGYDFVYGVEKNITSKSATELIQTYASKYDPVIEKYISTNYEYMSNH